MKKTSLLLIASFFLLSCNFNCTNSGGMFTGNGNIKTETRNVGEFTELTTSGSIDVQIIVGSKFELTVEDDENLLPHLITEVKDGSLNIHYDENFSFSDTHGKVIVTVPTLKKMTTSGSGDIKILGTLTNGNEIVFASSGSGDMEGAVDAPSIQLSISGSGDIDLKGKTQNLNCKLVGSGDVNCRDLKSENVVISLAGSSDVSVYASVSLKVNVAGSGDVVYGGNPTSPAINIIGSGTVKKAN